MKHQHTTQVLASVNVPPTVAIESTMTPLCHESIVPLYEHSAQQDPVEDVLPPLYYQTVSSPAFYAYRIPASGADRRPEFTVHTADKSVKIDMSLQRALLIISFPDDVNIKSCTVKKRNGHYIVTVDRLRDSNWFSNLRKFFV